MAIKLGNTDINSLGLINKAYLGVVEVFSGISFVSLWETTGAAETITLPTPTNYVVDWGDGTITTNTNNHEYANIGQYEIKIKGEINDFVFSNAGDKLKILSVSNFGKLAIMLDSFYGCSNLEVLSNEDYQLTGRMDNAFRDCASMSYLNANLLKWEGVTEMPFMFYNSALNSPIDIVSNSITNMIASFRLNSNFNSTINVNCPNVGGLFATFAQMSNLNKEVTLNVASCATLQETFVSNSSLNSTVTITTTTALKTVFQMFQSNTSLNTQFSISDTSGVTNWGSFMFNCTAWNLPLTLNTDSATSMANAFRSLNSMNALITLSDTSNVLSFLGCFNSMTVYNQPTVLDTSSCTSMQQMFYNSQRYNQNDFYDTSNVTNMSEMYFNCVDFDQDISNRDYSSVTNMNGFMTAKTAANYSTTNMDALYNKLDNAVGGLVFANMVNVNLTFGTINYTSAGATARASLVSKGFVIASGVEV